jgi:hypothetical protein
MADTQLRVRDNAGTLPDPARGLRTADLGNSPGGGRARDGIPEPRIRIARALALLLFIVIIFFAGLLVGTSFVTELPKLPLSALGLSRQNPPQAAPPAAAANGDRQPATASATPQPQSQTAGAPVENSPPPAKPEIAAEAPAAAKAAEAPQLASGAAAAAPAAIAKSQASPPAATGGVDDKAATQTATAGAPADQQIRAAGQPEPTEPGATAAAKPPPVAAAVSTTNPPAPASGGVRLAKAEIDALVARGNAFLGASDVTAARLFYRRGADAGDGTAALRLGETFDPAFLVRARLSPVSGDRTKALHWYRVARDLGSVDAAVLLKSLDPTEK